jgi:hypothetical protein
MPYVERDSVGRIAALSEKPTGRALEFLDDGSPELRHFLSRTRPQADPRQSQEALDSLRSSDAELVRVVEDLIELLVRKRTIAIEELPVPVRRKMEARARRRERYRANPLLRFDDDTI